MWLDAANCADYLYIFLIGINVIFSKKNGKIYQIFNKILEILYYIHNEWDLLLDQNLVSLV